MVFLKLTLKSREKKVKMLKEIHLFLFIVKFFVLNLFLGEYYLSVMHPLNCTIYTDYNYVWANMAYDVQGA